MPWIQELEPEDLTEAPDHSDSPISPSITGACSMEAASRDGWPHAGAARHQTLHTMPCAIDKVKIGEQLVRTMRFKASTLLFLVLPALGVTHHSRSEYSGDPIEFEGSLVRVLWRNPHPAFTVEVERDGQVETWHVEGWSSLYTFDRADIAQDRFAVGDTLRILGYASERRPGRILATHMMLADGTEAILKRDADPYWGENERLGGLERWEVETRAAVVDAVAENRGIFRVWSYPSPNVLTAQYYPLTESAQAARSEFDQVDNYIMRCESKSMPGSMLTPNPYEIIDGSDTIAIRGYEGDVVRTIHLDNAANPAAQPADPVAQPYSQQGYSVGHWEDDRTLVIHTSRINAGYLGFSGIPLSNEVEVVERYTLSEDQTRLDFHFAFTDPQTFTEPATAEYYWLALGEEFGQYDCDVH